LIRDHEQRHAGLNVFFFTSLRVSQDSLVQLVPQELTESRERREILELLEHMETLDQLYVNHSQNVSN